MTRNTHVPLEPYALAAGGEIVYLLRPEATEIKLTTIAHALAAKPRFSMHAAWPYSVAEHSLHVMHVARRTCPNDPEVALAALMHDAHEAYLGDVSTPVKQAVRKLGSDGFDRLDAMWSSRVRAVFGVSWDARIAEIVHHADYVALMTERHALVPASLAWPDMPEHERNDDWFVSRGARVRSWGGNSWRHVRGAFLAACRDLGVCP